MTIFAIISGESLFAPTIYDGEDEDTERYLSLHFSYTETLDYNTFLSQISDTISYNKTPLLSNLRRTIKTIYSKNIHK